MTFDGYTEEQVAYHQHLMLEAGLARGIDVSDISSIGPVAQLTGLTWHGHEFVEAARADTIWRKTLQFLRDKGGPLTMPFIQAGLKSSPTTFSGFPVTRRRSVVLLRRRTHYASSARRIEHRLRVVLVDCERLRRKVARAVPVLVQPVVRVRVEHQ